MIESVVTHRWQTSHRATSTHPAEIHEESLDPSLWEFVAKEAILLGSRYATKQEVVRAARMFADDRGTAHTAGSLDLDAVPDYHRRIRAGETHGAAILNP